MILLQSNFFESKFEDADNIKERKRTLFAVSIEQRRESIYIYMYTYSEIERNRGSYGHEHKGHGGRKKEGKVKMYEANA